jgi:hypothetical protein
MSQAIPGLELMTALQNQSGQAIQAMQYGIQNRQNQKQLEQADRRLDMAQEEWDANKPIRDLEITKAIMTGEYIKKNPDMITSSLNLARLQTQSEQDRLLTSVIFDRLHKNPGQEGFNAVKADIEKQGYNFANLTGLHAYSEQGVKQFFNSAINDFEYTKSIMEATQKAQIETQRIRSEKLFQAQLDAERDAAKLDAEVTTENFVDKSNNPVSKTKSGEFFRIDANGKRSYLGGDEVRELRPATGGGSGVSTVSGFFVDPKGNAQPAKTQGGIDGIVMDDGKFIPRGDLAKQGWTYNPANANDLVRQREETQNSMNSLRGIGDIYQAYTKTAAGNQPGAVIDVAKKYTEGINNLFGGIGGINERKDVLPGELDAAIAGVAAESGELGASSAKMFLAASLQARTLAGTNNAITKEQFKTSFKSLFGFEPDSIGQYLQDPRRVKAAMQASAKVMVANARDNVAKENGIVGGYRLATPAQKAIIDSRISTTTAVNPNDFTYTDSVASGANALLPNIVTFQRPDGSRVNATTQEQLDAYKSKGYTEVQQ